MWLIRMPWQIQVVILIMTCNDFAVVLWQEATFEAALGNRWTCDRDWDLPIHLKPSWNVRMMSTPSVCDPTGQSETQKISSLKWVKTNRNTFQDSKTRGGTTNKVQQMNPNSIKAKCQIVSQHLEEHHPYVVRIDCLGEGITVCRHRGGFVISIQTGYIFTHVKVLRLWDRSGQTRP